MLYLALSLEPCVAQDESEQDSADIESRHRLDFSLTYLDSFLVFLVVSVQS